MDVGELPGGVFSEFVFSIDFISRQATDDPLDVRSSSLSYE